MKRFLILTFLFYSCVSSTSEHNSSGDSSTTGEYEDFSEVTPFTIKEDILGNQLVINGKRKTVKDYLIRFYHPDTYTTRTQEDSIDAPKYIITEASVLEASFFGGEGRCEKRSMLITSRGDFIEQEYYDILVFGADKNGEPVLIDKYTFDGSQGQSSTIINVEIEPLSTVRNCGLLKVSSSSEGGDINLHKNEWVEYYMADEKSFRPVLKMVIEDTSIQDYEATQDENQNSSSEIRELEILKTSSNGLYDIRAHYVNRQNGSVIQDLEEVYTFNGSEYVSQKNKP